MMVSPCPTDFLNMASFDGSNTEKRDICSYASPSCTASSTLAVCFLHDKTFNRNGAEHSHVTAWSDRHNQPMIMLRS